METPKDRLRFFIEFMAISQSEFERACGFSHGYIANMRKAPSRKACIAIALRFPNLNTEWIKSGCGQMLVYGGKPQAVTNTERTRYAQMISFRDKRVCELEALVLQLQRKLDEQKHD